MKNITPQPAPEMDQEKKRQAFLDKALGGKADYETSNEEIEALAHQVACLRFLDDQHSPAASAKPRA